MPVAPKPPVRVCLRCVRRPLFVGTVLPAPSRLPPLQPSLGLPSRTVPHSPPGEPTRTLAPISARPIGLLVTTSPSPANLSHGPALAWGLPRCVLLSLHAFPLPQPTLHAPCRGSQTALPQSRPRPLPRPDTAPKGAAQGMRYEPSVPTVPIASWTRPAASFDYPGTAATSISQLICRSLPPRPSPSRVCAATRPLTAFRPVLADRACPSLHDGGVSHVRHSGRRRVRSLRCESRVDRRSPLRLVDE